MNAMMAAASITEDPRWTALRRRDRRQAGFSASAVSSTGVYCRPPCGARRPRPENVAFFADGEEARAAGFRPCKRCRPDEQGRETRLVAEACRAIETAGDMPSLEDLAAQAGLSPSHFHRLFKAATGLTPRAYAVAERAHRVREGLARAGSVTSAIYEAGFNASSRFYEASNAMLGMTPTDYREGGAQARILFALGQCSLGAILVARSARGICAISLGDDPEMLLRDLQDRFPKADLVGGDEAFERVVAEVVGFVEDPGLGLGLPLDIRGTAFQQRVWQALRDIPAGETATYAEVARRIGEPKAVRAVAGACAANAIAVAIPCHRVVRTDGSLSGYRWGVARKRDLLAREKVG
mgnify:CR=1 FL=1